MKELIFNGVLALVISALAGLVTKKLTNSKVAAQLIMTLVWVSLMVLLVVPTFQNAIGEIGKNLTVYIEQKNTKP